MDLDIDIRPDNLDSKHATSSPSTQSEISTDGDASSTQYSMLGADKISVSQSLTEPKTKKRRKQSKPIKCHNITSTTLDMQVEDMDIKMEDQEPESNEKSEEMNVSEPKKQKLEEDALNNNSESNASPESMSQKNILSSLNAMFYGSKIWGNDMLNLNVNKSKNSLQLLGEMGSHDTMEEGQYNFDPKTFFQGFYPQMPPLLPLNPNDLTGELSKLTNVFSQLSDLPTQLNQTNFGPSLSNRSFVTSNGVRVFNPEAYCELCEKEFCNKYFLKTHKANKHGVCSIDNGNSPYRSFKTSSANPVMPMQIPGPANENSPHSTADAYCNICQKSFCNKYFLKKHKQNIHGIAENGNDSYANLPSSIHVPVISSLQAGRLLDLKSEENSSDRTANEDQKLLDIALNNLKNKINGNHNVPFMNINGLSIGNSGGKVKFNKESKNDKFLCELCNIEFCDKHYLDIHKHNRHTSEMSPKQDQKYPEFSEIGKFENVEKFGKALEELERSKSQICVPCIKSFPNAESFQNHMSEAHGAGGSSDDNGIQISSNNENKNNAKEIASPHSRSSDSEHSNESSDPGFYCSLCFTKFKDKDSLHSHFEMSHNVHGSITNSNGSADLKESCLVAVPALHQPELEQQCDACPIKFFDKYLLASHRLKVHGIISPMLESPLSAPDTEIVKGIVSDYSFLMNDKFRNSMVKSFCRICNKELCNKYFMKTHMLKMHGIDVDKLHAEQGVNNVSTIVCDICSKSFGDKSLLKFHNLNVHGIVESQESVTTNICEKNDTGTLPKESHHIQKICTKTEAGPVREKTFSCDICSQEFQSKLMLQMHLINKHVNSTESGVTSFGGLLGLANNLDQNFAGHSKQNGSCKENVEKEISCSCCSLVNLNNSSFHDKQSPQDCTADVKTLLCYVCNVSYPHSEHYQHHLTHRDLIESEMKSQVSSSSFLDKTNLDSSIHKNKVRPRKIKRFRCSKCDKSFRTRNKCLHHIQVVHKNRKIPGLSLTTDPLLAMTIRKPLINHFIPKPSSEEQAALHAKTSNNILPKLPLKVNEKNSVLKEGQSLPVPYMLPKNSKDVIMQPFHLTEPSSDGLSKPDVFVPSLVYLPVNKKVSGPVTVSFTLTPA